MSEYIERQVEVWEDHVRVGSIGNLWVSNAVKYLRMLLDENTTLEQRIEKLREGCEAIAIQEGCSEGEDCDQTCVKQYNAGAEIVPCAGCFAQIVLEADDELAKGGKW